MDFSSVAYMLAAFLTVFGGLILWISFHEPAGKSKIFNLKNLIFLFAMLYFSLAHFSVLTGLAYGVELTNEAPCENIILTQNLTGNVTTYSYTDSCLTRTTPEAVQRLFVAYSWLIYIDLFALAVGLFFITIWRAIIKW